MGGGQSLNFGLANLNTFAWVGGFSSAPNTAQPAQLVPDAAAARKQLKLLWVSCGDKDSLFNISEGVHKYRDEQKVAVWHIEWRAHTSGFGRRPLPFRPGSSDEKAVVVAPRRRRFDGRRRVRAGSRCATGCRRQRHRHHHRVVRLLHLRHRRGHRVRAAILPPGVGAGRHAGGVCHLRHRLHRPSARRRGDGPLRRSARPQVHAGVVPDADGAGHARYRPAPTTRR